MCRVRKTEKWDYSELVHEMISHSANPNAEHTFCRASANRAARFFFFRVARFWKHCLPNPRMQFGSQSKGATLAGACTAVTQTPLWCCMEMALSSETLQQMCLPGESCRKQNGYWEFVPANQRRTFSDFGRSLTRSLLANWPKCNWLHKEIRIIPFCVWGQFESSLASSKEQLSQYFLNQNLLKSHTFCLEYSVPKYTLNAHMCVYMWTHPINTHPNSFSSFRPHLDQII